MITDGAIHDANEIREREFSCLCTTVTPLNGSWRWRLAETGVPVSLTGGAAPLFTSHPEISLPLTVTGS